MRDMNMMSTGFSHMDGAMHKNGDLSIIYILFARQRGLIRHPLCTHPFPCCMLITCTIHS